jgi:hypothetical protein
MKKKPEALDEASMALPVNNWRPRQTWKIEALKYPPGPWYSPGQ